MRRALALLATTLSLSACGQPAPVPEAASNWAFAIGKNSVEMAWLVDPTAPANPPLRLVCARGGGFRVSVTAFKPIGSEERLTIGAGDEAFALVAIAAENEHGALVRATGPVEAGLMAMIESGKPIAASYGAQSFGPVDAPPQAMRRAFADSCRKLDGEAAV
ncbi:MAG: hypothetical protein Q8L66_04130 [Caulobacter sp.]|nr:hypothetical protein [Caulobacter sp.]